MTWAAQIRWSYRGPHQLGVILHADSENEFWYRIFTVLPSTVFLSSDWEIAMCPTDRLLEPRAEYQEIAA